MSDINPCFTLDIWLEILKRLPVKTIGRCLFVCKNWKTLIMSPSFVAAHIEDSAQIKGNSGLLYRQFTNAPQKHEEYMLFPDSNEKEVNLEPLCSFTCPFRTLQGSEFFRVVGSVNGLICLSDDLFGYTFFLILWNPLIHKYIILPMPKADVILKGGFICAYGLGYDSKKASHKVVKVSYKKNFDPLVDITPPLVEVYSVQEGEWKSVSAQNVVDICICDFWWSQCFLNRAIHWVAWDRDAETLAFHSNCLLLFDVEEEKFKKMKLPEPLTGKDCALKLHVSEYDGKLSVLHSVLKGSVIGNEMTRCEIWVKKEYNVRTSWCKVFSIEMNSIANLGSVQCLRKNGDVLGFTKKGELVSYDPVTNQIKKFGIRGRWRSWFTCSFSGSLTLLDKRSSVGSYDAARGPKTKKFRVITLRGGILDMEEKNVTSDREDKEDQSAGLSTFYHQGKAILLEQMMKFDGVNMMADPEEYISMAGFDISEFMSTALHVANYL